MSDRHYVGRDDVEVVEFACGICGTTIDCIDGETFEHRDPDLNPIEEGEAFVTPKEADHD